MSAREPAPGSKHDDSYELGELELAPRPRPSQQAVDEGLSTSALAELRALEGLAPRGSQPANDLPLELSLARSEPAGSEFGDEDALLGPALELDLPDDHPALVRSSGPPRPAPSLPQPSRAPRPINPRDEERAARELAGYGEPILGLGAARYVLRVLRRSWLLRRERRTVEHAASELAARYEQALGTLGRALLEDRQVLEHPALRERVAAVQAKQQALALAEQAAEAAEARDDGARQRLERERADLARQLAPFFAEEQRTAHAERQAEAALRRHKALLQRAAIELRALSKASIPPPPERVQQLEAARVERTRELDALEAAHAEANAALGRARRELALRRGGLDTVERQLAQQRDALEARAAQLEAEKTAAEHALSAALCALAEAADSFGLAHAAAEQVAGLRASETALDQVVDQLARYDRALALYDRDAAVRGALIWAALLAGLVIALRLLSRL